MSDEGVSLKIPKAFRAAAAHAIPVLAPTRPRRVRAAPKVVPPPRRSAAATEARHSSATGNAPAQRCGPQWVRPELLERGMMVLCQDGVRGVVESAFAALDEVYVLRHGTKEAVKLKTNQITFLGDWSDSVEVINSVEVPPDIEAILGLEQLDQLQDLAGKAPVHLESLPQEGAGGALAQLVIGPSTAKAVKAAVDAIVSHVDGLDYPEGSYAKAASDGTAGAAAANAANATDPADVYGLAAASDQWMSSIATLPQAATSLFPTGSPPMMMVCPVWPGSTPSWAEWPAASTWAGQTMPVPDQNLLGSTAWQDPALTVEVPVEVEQAPVQEIPLRDTSTQPVKEDRPSSAAPPWRNKDLPPPPEKKLAEKKLTAKRQPEKEVRSGTTVKRYRASSLTAKKREGSMDVKQEVLEEPEEEASGLRAASAAEENGRAGRTAAVAPSSPTRSAQDEANKTVLFWATQQDEFAHLPQLPDGWIRIPSKSAGSFYYVNLTTGKTTFRSPLDLPPGWVKVMSRSTGKEYYWNAEKQISQFEIPAE